MGEFRILKSVDDVLRINWTNDRDWAELSVDLSKMEMEIQFSDHNDMTEITFNEIKQ
jgi:hypothetical protein